MDAFTPQRCGIETQSIRKTVVLPATRNNDEVNGKIKILSSRDDTVKCGKISFVALDLPTSLTMAVGASPPSWAREVLTGNYPEVDKMCIRNIDTKSRINIKSTILETAAVCVRCIHTDGSCFKNSKYDAYA